MRIRATRSVILMALGAAITMAMLAGVAQAKLWAKLAPAPLASDSAFAAMQARPTDSLTVSEFLWLGVQRDWRAERDRETRPPVWPEERYVHHLRRTAARFAALASLPCAALTERERAWLVAENAERRAERERAALSNGSSFLVLGLLVGVLGGGWLVINALSNTLGVP